MRLLIISAGHWTGGGCFGSTYSSIFGGISDLEIAHVYCGTGLPTADVPANVVRFFQTNEKRLLRNLLHRNIPAGAEVFRKTAESESCGEHAAEFSRRETECVNFFRRHHWSWLKYLNYYTTWNVGRWRSPELRSFVESFQPDAIWTAVSPIPPVLRMSAYLRRLTGLPATGYVYDEHYSLKKFRFSPAYWLFHLATRRMIRRTLISCRSFYVISDAQKEYYERKFGVPCRVITRTLDFSGNPPSAQPIPQNEQILLVYAGNLSNGRYRALMRIGNAIRESKLNARLDVYSAQPVSRRLRKSLESSGNVQFCGKVPASEIGQILARADILVHAEGFGRAYRLSARMAFSTKIVEYLHSGKPILAVGPREMNSISYFERNKCGFAAETIPEIADALVKLANEPDSVQRLITQARLTGKMNHQTAPAQTKLYQELQKLADR